MKRIILALLLCLTAIGLFSQNMGNYNFTTNMTGSLALDINGNDLNMSSGTTTLINAYSYTDDAYSSVYNIGFTAYFLGSTYTQFSVNSNGQMKLGATSIGYYAYTTPSNNETFLVPLTGDNALVSGGKVISKLFNNTPNRVLVVEWNGFRIPSGNVAETGTYCRFQARIYESGVIEYVYGTMYNMVISAQNRSIGLSYGYGVGNIGTVTNLTTSPTFVSTGQSFTVTSFPSGIVPNMSSTEDGSRRVFRFTPQQNIPNSPTDITFSSVGTTSMTVNWVDNSDNETYYRITHATNADFTQNITTKTVSSTTISSTGSAYNASLTVSANTTYYVRISAVNEANPESAYLIGSQLTASSTLYGVKAIPGDYASLTAAFNAINTQGLGGDINLVLQSNYTGAGETYPLRGPLSSVTENGYFVKIYPAVSGLMITSTNTTATFELKNTANLILDGRVGGTGDVADLIIDNTANTTSIPTIKLIDDSHHNTFTYCLIRKSFPACSYAAVMIYNTTLVNGNDFNTISYCKIGSSNFNKYGIISYGTENKENSGNVITHNEIFNFNPNSSSGEGQYAGGVYANSYTRDWTITHNSFYQTVPYSLNSYSLGSNTVVIYISGGSGNSVVTDNYIGGSEAMCGGSAWEVTGNAVNAMFKGIYIWGSTGATGLVENNVIANIKWKSNTGNGPNYPAFLGIGNNTNTSLGQFDFIGNIIGSASTPGSIQITSENVTNPAWVTGLLINKSTSIIRDNVISGITTIGNTTSNPSSFCGMYFFNNPGSYNVYNNTIGSSILENSINISNAYTGTVVQQALGIDLYYSGNTNIYNNTIANINNNYAPAAASTANIVVGIRSGTSSYMLNTYGNKIFNLTTGANATGTGTNASVAGIVNPSTYATPNIYRNSIYSLTNTNSSGDVKVVGIAMGASSNTPSISKNLIHSLQINSSSVNSAIAGIMGENTTNIFNNMIRLGYMYDGTSLNSSGAIYGIYEGTGSCHNNYNSVYIGGTQSVESNTVSYALYNTATATRYYYNNIFMNTRSNATSGGKHYAIRLGGTTYGMSSLNSNKNILLATGNGGYTGYFNSSDCQTISDWRIATGKDANSIGINPGFINPDGNGSEFNLHINPAQSSPCEGYGTTPSYASITDDFDGESRASLTPIDIGADAGNFTTQDLAGPTIRYTALANCYLAGARILTATITDASGVPTSGNGLPVLYWKRNSETFTAVQGISLGSDQYSFTFGASVVQGETVSYFVAAQDNSANTNVSIYPSAGSFNLYANSPGCTTTPTSPSTYVFAESFSGTYYVGSGQPYTSLSSSGGLFSAINSSVLTGNVEVLITSDVNETGVYALNQWTDVRKNEFTITIKPATASIKTLSGSNSNGLIRFNGADGVTIDGNFNGTGEYLKFIYTNTAKPALDLTAGACSNVFKNCIFEGTNNTTGVINLETVSTIGNNNNIFDNCTIREVSETSSRSMYGFYSQGSPSVSNSGNIIRNCKVFNFKVSGIFLDATGNESWTIQNNELYQTVEYSATIYGLNLNSKGTNNISGNKIHDIKGGAGNVYSINIDNLENASFSNNYIYNMHTTGVCYGICFSGASSTASTYTFTNNKIVLTNTNIQTIAFYDISSLAHSVNLYYNTFYTGGTNTNNNWVYLRNNGSTTNCNLKNNIFMNCTTNNSFGHYAVGDHTIGAGQLNLFSNYYVGINTSPDLYMDKSATSVPAAISLDSWKTQLSDQLSIGTRSNLINATGLFNNLTNDFTVSTIHNDYLNLPEFMNKASVITEVTTDYSGIARDGSTPDIGADEFGTIQTNLNETGTLPTGTFEDIIVNGDNAVCELVGATTVTGDLNIINGTVEIGNNVLTLAGQLIGSNLAGDINSVLNIIGSETALNLPEITLNQLQISRPAGVSLSGNISLSNLVVNSGTLHLNSHQVNLNNEYFGVSGSGTLNEIQAEYLEIQSSPSVAEAFQKVWSSAGTSTGNLTLIFSYPASECTSSSVFLWYKDNLESKWNLIGQRNTTLNNGTMYVLLENISSLNAESKGNKYWAISEDSQTLPVQMSSFTSIALNNNIVQLQWITESEINLFGYNVFRSIVKNTQTMERQNFSLISMNEAVSEGTQNTYRYTDPSPKADGDYYYWLERCEFDGTSTLFGPLTVKIASNQSSEPEIPVVTELKNAYPNPFNPSTYINYSLKETQKVCIEIFNVKGEKVRTLVHENQSAGRYRLEWNGKDSKNKTVGTGVYFYKMKTPHYTSIKKMMMLK